MKARRRYLDDAALLLMIAALVVGLAFYTGHPLAASLAWFPLRWGVERVALAVEVSRRPTPEDFGQGADQ